MPNTLILLVAFLLAAWPAHAEEVRVVASIKPLHSLVAGVMEGVGKPELLVSGNESAHDFQLKPSQAESIRRARLVFYIDEQFEKFMKKPLAELPAGRALPISRSEGLTVWPQRVGGVWDQRAHAHDAEPDHHDDARPDLHLWLDPLNAQAIVRFIAQHLGEAYPASQARFAVNAEKMIARLGELDAKLQAELTGIGAKPFLVFHDAYQYFEQRYGLQASGSITFEPHEAASPGRLTRLRELVRDEQIACVFREPAFDDRRVLTIIEGSSAKSRALDPEGTNLTPGRELYFQMMQKLADDVKGCLAGG